MELGGQFRFCAHGVELKVETPRIQPDRFQPILSNSATKVNATSTHQKISNAFGLPKLNTEHISHIGGVLTAIARHCSAAKAALEARLRA
jgi:hypothetical protein